MRDKSIVNLLIRHGFPHVVAEGFKHMVTAETDPVNGDVSVLTGQSLLVIGDGAPSNSDGRPDGTIYIQRG